MDTQFLLTEIFGNTLQEYSWFFGAIILGLLFKKLKSRIQNNYREFPTHQNYP